MKMLQLRAAPSVDHLQALSAPRPRWSRDLLFSQHALWQFLERNCENSQNLTWHVPLVSVRSAIKKQCSIKHPLPWSLHSEHPSTVVQCFTYSTSSHTKIQACILMRFLWMYLVRILWRSAVCHGSLCSIRDGWCEALSMFFSHLAADDERLIHLSKYVYWDFSKEAQEVWWWDQWISMTTQHQYYTHILYSLVWPNQTAIWQANSYNLCHRLQVLVL